MQNQSTKTRAHRGFTLIELLVVLSVLAVLSSFTLPYLSFSPPSEEATRLTELRDELSTYRAQALRESERITLIINENSTVDVYAGRFYEETTLGEEKVDPKETFKIASGFEIYSATGDEAPYSLRFEPDGRSSVIHFVYKDNVLAFNGTATAPSIMPYDKVKP